jgi:hypothetical protein
MLFSPNFQLAELRLDMNVALLKSLDGYTDPCCSLRFVCLIFDCARSRGRMREVGE